MNGKKLACVVLMIFIGIATYAGQIVHQKATAKRTEAETAESDANAAKSELEIAETRTTKLRYDSDELRRFLTAWTVHIDRIQTQGQVEESILASLRNASMLILSQKFEVRDNRTTPVIPKIVRASLVLEDDYAKTLNWVGELERRLPLARMMNCRITGGENGRQVHAEITLEVPLVNLLAEMPVVAAATVKKPSA